MKLVTFALLFIWAIVCIIECESLLLSHGRVPSMRGIVGASWKISNLSRRFSAHDSGVCSDDFSAEMRETEETEDGIGPCDSDSIQSTACQAVEISENEDPQVIAQRELEKELEAELKSARDLLRKEQSELFDIQEKLFESGKNGYLLVQAQINDFSKKRQAEQVKKIEEIKKKVVEKIAPLLENFRAVSTTFPGETERENKMHSDFAVVTKSITIALKKYGYEEPLTVQAKEESSYTATN